MRRDHSGTQRGRLSAERAAEPGQFASHRRSPVENAGLTDTELTRPPVIDKAQLGWRDKAQLGSRGGTSRDASPLSCNRVDMRPGGSTDGGFLVPPADLIGFVRPVRWPGSWRLEKGAAGPEWSSTGRRLVPAACGGMDPPARLNARLAHRFHDTVAAGAAEAHDEVGGRYPRERLSVYAQRHLGRLRPPARCESERSRSRHSTPRSSGLF